jgi:FkbM family methyltransferase
MSRVLGAHTSRMLRAYYRSPDHLMKLRIWGWLRSAFGYPPFTISYCDGGRLIVDERDLVQRQVFLNGHYEPEVWDALFSFASRSEVVWDIGAHIGTFTVKSILDQRVATVHAFEPDPSVCRALERNVHINQRSTVSCSVHSFAVSAIPGRANLYRAPLCNLGIGSLASKPTAQWIAVDCKSVDDLVYVDKLPAPTLMKVDVEGSEADVMRGAERVLRNACLKAIVLETEADEVGEIIDKKLSRYLSVMGYAVTWIRRPSGAIEPRENYLAVRSI